MSRLFTHAWGLNSLTDGMELFRGASQTGSIVTSPVYNGTYAYRLNPSASVQNLQFGFSPSGTLTTVYFRFPYYASVHPAADNLMFFLSPDGATPCFRFRGTGAGFKVMDAANAQIGSNVVLNTGQWYVITGKIVSHASAGTVDILVDGSSVVSATGKNTSGGNMLIAFFGSGAACTGTYYIGHFAINDGNGTVENSYPDWKAKVVYVRPAGAGDSTQWTPSTGDNYACVDEVTPNDATDYVSATTTSHSDYYTVGASGIGASDTINVVHIGHRYRNGTADAVTAMKIQLIKASGGTQALSAAMTSGSTTWRTNGAGVSFNPYPITLYKDPDNTAWTQATIDSMQIGSTITTGGTNAIQLSAIWAVVDYTPAAAQDGTGDLTSGGQEITSAAGSQTPAIEASLSGQEITSAIGDLTASVESNDVSLELTGQEAVSASGSLLPSLVTPVVVSPNLLSNTSALDTSPWDPFDATVTQDGTAGPFGDANEAWLLKEDSTANQFHQDRQSVTVADGNYEHAVYAKQGPGTRKLVLTFALNRAIFDVSAGTILNQAGFIEARISDAGGGWWRCSIVEGTTSGAKYVTFGLASSGTVSSYSGNGTSGIYLARPYFAKAVQSIFAYRDVLTPEALPNFQGQSASTNSGSIVGLVAGPLQGQEIVSAHGDVSASAAGNVSLQGQVVTTARGNLATSVVKALTGQSVSFDYGTITASIVDVINYAYASWVQVETPEQLIVSGGATLSGQAAGFAAGSLAVSSTLVVVGRAASPIAGSLAVGQTVSVSGQDATVDKGTLSASVSSTTQYGYASWAQVEMPASSGAGVVLSGKRISTAIGDLLPSITRVIPGIRAQFSFTTFSNGRGYVSWAQVETPQSNNKLVSLIGRSFSIVQGSLGIVSGTFANIYGYDQFITSADFVGDLRVGLVGNEIAVTSGILGGSQETYIFYGQVVPTVIAGLVGYGIVLTRGTVSVLNQGSGVTVLDGSQLNIFALPPSPASAFNLSGFDLAVGQGSIAASTENPVDMDGISLAIDYGSFIMDRSLSLTGKDLSLSLASLSAVTHMVLGGYELASAAGEFGVPDLSVQIHGHAMLVERGAINIETATEQSVSLIGASMTMLPGGVSLELQIMVPGLQLVTSYGSLGQVILGFAPLIGKQVDVGFKTVTPDIGNSLIGKSMSIASGVMDVVGGGGLGGVIVGLQGFSLQADSATLDENYVTVGMVGQEFVAVPGIFPPEGHSLERTWVIPPEDRGFIVVPEDRTFVPKD